MAHLLNKTTPPKPFQTTPSTKYSNTRACGGHSHSEHHVRLFNHLFETKNLVHLFYISGQLSHYGFCGSYCLLLDLDKDFPEYHVQSHAKSLEDMPQLNQPTTTEHWLYSITRWLSLAGSYMIDHQPFCFFSLCLFSSRQNQAFDIMTESVCQKTLLIH